MIDPTSIRRGFVDVGVGQLHYRTRGQGEGLPLILLHASPGSSKQLEKRMHSFSPARCLIAPDRPGNGDSPPLDLPSPEIADYARTMIEALDGLGIARADLYGTHTGASIALEMAILAPDRVRRIVTDGLSSYTDEMRERMLAHYAPPFPPNLNGTHLIDAFMFCRDQYLFAPWFDHSREASRQNGLPSPDDLHEWVLEVLKAPTTYPLGYHASFRYRKDERLPLVRQPVLALAAEDDMLRASTISLAEQYPNVLFRSLPRYDAPDYLAELARAVEDFTAEPDRSSNRAG